MKRSIVIIIVFMLLMVGFSIAWFFMIPKDYNDKVDTIENRMLAPKPSLNIHSLFEFPESYENYFNDHIPFRKVLMEMYAKIEYCLFRRSISDSVILGNNGWLYYSKKEDGDSIKSFKGIDLYTETQMQLIADNLMQFRNAVEKEGVGSFYIFFAPNKEHIYPEYMPETIKQVTGKNRLDELVKYLKKYTDLNIIYPKDYLLDKKTEYTTYYKTDTHWNKIGAYFAADYMLSCLGVGNLPDIDGIDIDCGHEYIGDLMKMGRLDSIIKGDFEYEIQYDSKRAVNTICEESDNYIHNKTDSSNKTKLLMVRDSFASALIDYISPIFEESIYIHWRSFDFNMIKKEKPDIVIMEIVERSLPLLYDFSVLNYSTF